MMEEEEGEASEEHGQVMDLPLPIVPDSKPTRMEPCRYCASKRSTTINNNNNNNNPRMALDDAAACPCMHRLCLVCVVRFLLPKVADVVTLASTGNLRELPTLVVACPECRSPVYTLTCGLSHIKSHKDKHTHTNVTATIAPSLPLPNEEVNAFYVPCDMEIAHETEDGQHDTHQNAWCDMLPPWLRLLLRVLVQVVSVTVSVWMIATLMSDSLGLGMLSFEFFVLLLSLMGTADETPSPVIAALSLINLCLRITSAVVNTHRTPDPKVWLVQIIGLILHSIHCLYIAWSMPCTRVKVNNYTPHYLDHIQASFLILRGRWRGNTCRVRYPVGHLGIEMV
jgi:hypothetical protein